MALPAIILQHCTVYFTIASPCYSYVWDETTCLPWRRWKCAEPQISSGPELCQMLNCTEPTNFNNSFNLDTTKMGSSNHPNESHIIFNSTKEGAKRITLGIPKYNISKNGTKADISKFNSTKDVIKKFERTTTSIKTFKDVSNKSEETLLRSQATNEVNKEILAQPADVNGLVVADKPPVDYNLAMAKPADFTPHLLQLRKDMESFKAMLKQVMKQEILCPDGKRCTVSSEFKEECIIYSDCSLPCELKSCKMKMLYDVDCTIYECTLLPTPKITILAGMLLVIAPLTVSCLIGLACWGTYLIFKHKKTASYRFLPDDCDIAETNRLNESVTQRFAWLREATGISNATASDEILQNDPEAIFTEPEVRTSAELHSVTSRTNEFLNRHPRFLNLISRNYSTTLPSGSPPRFPIAGEPGNEDIETQSSRFKAKFKKCQRPAEKNLSQRIERCESFIP